VRRATATALTALTTLGALAATMAPASAEVVSVEDATQNDVGGFSGGLDRAAGISNAYTDIVSTTLDYRRSTVVMTVAIADVARYYDSELQGQMNTPDGGQYLARVQYGSERPTLAFLQDLDDPGNEIQCDVKAAVKVEADQVVVQVPRGCLGKPETVQFGARALTTVGGYTLVDDARRKQRPTSLEQPIKIGPRKVARG
jgi:hypothetical protein